MEAVNLMRAVLVAAAALTAIGAAVAGQWLVVGILVPALLAHAWMWWYLARLRAGPHRTQPRR